MSSKSAATKESIFFFSGLIFKICIRMEVGRFKNKKNKKNSAYKDGNERGVRQILFPNQKQDHLCNLITLTGKGLGSF